MKFKAWFIAMLFALGVGLFAVKHQQHLRRAGALTPVLNTHWNPYNHSPEYLQRYPYEMRAKYFERYISKKHPSVAELANEILRVENDAKLGHNPTRATRVAELLLKAYQEQK